MNLRTRNILGTCSFVLGASVITSISMGFSPRAFFVNDPLPFTFSDGQIASASQVNANFDALVNRTDIDADNIVPNSVTGALIAQDTIDSSEIAPNAVGQSELGTGAATTLKIQDGTILNEDISATAAISGSKVNPSFVSSVVLNNNDLYLRSGGDQNHGLGWYGPAQPFGSLLPDGPVLYGFGGGALGTTSGGEQASVVWNSSQSVALTGASVFGNVGVNIENDQVFGVRSVTNNTGSGFRAALFGVAELDLSGFGAGVWGVSSSSNIDAVVAEGSLAVTGNKQFVSPHPTDPAKQINFVCLEGNESGTYFRGTATLVNGRATVEVPEDFRMVTDAVHLTVQLTATARGQVWVESSSLDELEIHGESDMDVHYLVNGVRRGYANHQTIRPNTKYRPRVRDKKFGGQYPAEIREMLVANGILNANYTPNESTAAALGWSMQDADAESERPQEAPAAAVQVDVAPVNDRSQRQPVPIEAPR